MKTRIAWLLLWCLVLSGAAPARDIPAPDRFTGVRKFIEQGVADNQAPSVAVAVFRGRNIVWAEGFGSANLEYQSPATSDSLYLLASVSKPITATGIMKLVDRGLLDLDRPANSFLPDFKIRAHRGRAADITLRRLANHTSGLPTHYSFFYNGIEPPTREETIRRYAFAWRRPGGQFEYCNLAFGILDYLIEVQSGQPFDEFLRDEIFLPAGMTHTTMEPSGRLRRLATRQYAPDAGGRFLEVAPYRFDHDGASAFWSSANDLARFLQMHLNDGRIDDRQIISEDSAREMRRRAGKANYGVAWHVGRYLGQPSIAHSGGMPGVATRIRAFPEHDCGFVVLLNSPAYGFRREISKRITQALIPEAKEPGQKSNDSAPRPDPAPFVGKWAGAIHHFNGHIPLELTIPRKGPVKAVFGNGATETVADLSIRDGLWTGRTAARIETQPSYHGLVNLGFKLERQGPRLVGLANAFMRDYFTLPHWVDLKRVANPAELGADEPAFDVVIRNGRIVDGTGAPWFQADVGIRNGRIARIGRLDDTDAETRIDASGLVVAPGFIDMMGQTAAPLLENPEAANNLLAQGVTTILAGEGHSPAPLSAPEAKRQGWRTMREYFAKVEAIGIPINVAQSVGHTQIRRLVIGSVDRPPTPAELEEMQALVREAMEAGAVGVSTALIYPPAVYASEEEIAALCAVAGEYGGRYFTHMRNEGDRLLEAIDEAISIGRNAGTPVHIFHLKAAGRNNWPKMEQALQRIRRARAEGMEVDADIYPYIHNGLGLQAFIHPRHFAEGPQEFYRRIQQPEQRAVMRSEMESGDGWENWFRHAGHDWNKVILGRIDTAAYKQHAGKSLGAIAAELGKDPWDFFWELLPNGAFALPQSMSPENKLRALEAGFVSICTDVGPSGGSRIASHPRGYGAIARVLAHYVRGKNALSFEDAVARMTSLAANQILARDRGRIAEGLAADLVLLDPGRIQDQSTFAHPDRPASGVHAVLVNGQLVWDRNRFTGNKPGRVLRGPGFDR